MASQQRLFLEINLIDGGTTLGTTVVAGGDGLITNDNGTMQQTTVDTFDVDTRCSKRRFTNKTLTSLELSINTSVSGSDIKDEDDMSSNSATALATQQSIKAYVDTQLTVQKI